MRTVTSSGPRPTIRLVIRNVECSRERPTACFNSSISCCVAGSGCSSNTSRRDAGSSAEGTTSTASRFANSMRRSIARSRSPCLSIASGGAAGMNPGSRRLLIRCRHMTSNWSGGQPDWTREKTTSVGTAVVIWLANAWPVSGLYVIVGRSM